MEKVFSTEFLIVGGGLSGLIAARMLQSKEIAFVALEKSNSLGGRAETGPHRLSSENSVSTLKNLCPEVQWTNIETVPKERVKGEWQEIKTELSDEEKFYLRCNYFEAKAPFHHVIEELAAPVREKFLLNKAVKELDPAQRTVETTDGEVFQFKKLIWCTNLELLAKAWKSSSLPKSLSGKHTAIPAGVSLAFSLKDRLDFENRLSLFVFRYKEWRLHAIGIPEFNNQDSSKLTWLVFLESEILEDHEELAKCIRTLKRELLKEFPELKEAIESEKIIHLPSLSGEQANHLKSLEIHPGIFYLGTQAVTQDSDASLWNIDRLIANSAHLQNLLVSPS